MTGICTIALLCLTGSLNMDGNHPAFSILWITHSSLNMLVNRPLDMVLAMILTIPMLRPKKRNSLFPVTVRKKIGLSVKNFFLHYFLGRKCMFYACFSLIGSWEGEKKFGVGFFLNKNLLG